jgi:RNA polymerase sigma-70 factor (ECF subfamily)
VQFVASAALHMFLPSDQRKLDPTDPTSADQKSRLVRDEVAVDTRGDPIRKSVARVQQALDTLDHEHRAAFVLYEIEGETCDAIAISFGVPVGTIYSRLHFARRRFLAAYAALTRDDPTAARPRFAEGG